LIEKEAKFAHDEHLGYITSCPTNLGTALRASVHIKLPLLAKNNEEFDKIAKNSTCKSEVSTESTPRQMTESSIFPTRGDLEDPRLN